MQDRDRWTVRMETGADLLLWRGGGREARRLHRVMDREVRIYTTEVHYYSANSQS